MNAEVALPDFESHSVRPEILVFGEDATKADIIAELATRIPQNEFGLPDFFFRSDLIQGKQLDDADIDAAAVGLFYYDGYPTLENGSSFWNQLPHEPYTAFQLFQAYLDQAEDIGIRQFDLLAAQENKTLQEISDLAKEFFWQARSRAYDMFIVAANAKKRQRRIMKMEDEHYDATDKLRKKLMGRFEGDFDDWIEELTAKEAIEALAELVKIQRASVGLVGQHASSTSRDLAPGESTESVLRKLANQNANSQVQGGDFAQLLRNMLDNPEEGATVQAAILQITAKDNRQTFSEDH